MAREKRVQVLMEPGDFDRLEALALQENTSVGELIRRAVRERYLAGSRQQMAAATDLNALRLPALATEHLDGALTISRTDGLR